MHIDNFLHMELLVKFFRNHQRSFTKQKQDKEENEALLRRENGYQMAQTDEVVVDFDGNYGRSKKEAAATASKITGSASSSSNELENSQEKSNAESAQKRKQDLQNQQHLQQSTNSGEDDITLRSTANVSFQRHLWKPRISRTKSRLIDPPEESCVSLEGVNSERQRQPENDCDFEVDDVEDIPEDYKRMRFNAFTVLQWVCLALVVAALVSNLWISGLERLKLWDLSLWEWEIMIFVLICGRLVSGWTVKITVFLVERNFILRKRVLYFVYGLKRAVTNCIWLGLVLLVWHFILSNAVEKKVNNKILSFVTKILVCLFIGTVSWLLKTLLIKVFALSFHVNTFFERVREALFNQYVIKTLSGPPLIEGEVEDTSRRDLGPSNSVRSWRLIRNARLLRSSKFVKSLSQKQRQDEEITIDQLHKMNRRNISAWNMKKMINIIRHGAFTTLDEQILNSDNEDESLLQIRTEWQAKDAAKKIFQNVAKPGYQYIYLEDVMQFVRKDEALKTMELLGALPADKGISKTSLKEWMVNAFRERRALALSLNDTKTAVDELHNLLNTLVAVIILITWLVILGTPILHFVVLISSQLLLVVFMFGNTCRMVFEAIIFLFVMHPLDVGDRCEVEGVQMVVEEMNILNTVFLKYDNQKIIYPNSVLATKPISNYQRSPDMGDAVDFCIHISTPLDRIAAMKRKITEYIERKNEHWHPNPMVIMRDVEELNKLSMSVWLTHKMNYQNIMERWRRRGQLIEEMIQVFRELDVEYRLLPLDVNVRSRPI